MWEPKPRRVPLPLGPAPGLCEKTTSRLLAPGPARLTWLPVCAWELLLPSGPGPRHGQGVLPPLPRVPVGRAGDSDKTRVRCLRGLFGGVLSCWMGLGVRVLMQHMESPDQDPSPPLHPKSPVAVQGEP